MTCTVTGATIQECLNKVALLQRFGWAIQKPLYFENRQWKIVLYLKV